MIAVVGSSGGGKTTLCQLIPRFYDVTTGSIRIDGTDIRDVTKESLRSAVGIVQQEVFIFPDTIMENIRYGRPGATDEEVILAAREAEIYDDILEMKDGFSTYVGERGTRLSGGQRQRISIARIFLKDPKILILDNEFVNALSLAFDRVRFTPYSHILPGQMQFFRVRLHTLYDEIRHAADIHAEHLTPCKDQGAVALGGKFFILPLFHETLQFHIRDPVRAHPGGRLHDPGQLIYCEKALLHICLGLYICADRIAMSHDGTDILFGHTQLSEWLFCVRQMLVRVLLIIKIMQPADGFPLFFVPTEMLRHGAHCSGDVRRMQEQMLLRYHSRVDLFCFL